MAEEEVPVPSWIVVQLMGLDFPLLLARRATWPNQPEASKKATGVAAPRTTGPVSRKVAFHVHPTDENGLIGTMDG